MNETRQVRRTPQGTRRGTRAGARTANWSGVLAEQGYVIGIDISGGGERVAISNLSGEIVNNAEYLHNTEVSHEPRQVVQRVTNMVSDLLGSEGIRNREVLRIGIGFGGPVDSGKGLVRRSYVASGWDGFPIAARIEEAFDVPTLLDNDARLAALGEVWFGAGRDITPCDLVYLHWSTGVGGGIVSEGKLIRGAGSLAGEVGHMVVRSGPDALPCRCGGRGHLEAYVRASALIERAVLASPGLRDSSNKEPLTAGSILGNPGDDPALTALAEETVDLLAQAVGNLVTLADPHIVVIGGRVARECPECVSRVAQAAPGYAMPLAAEGVKIVPAALGENSGVMGAVALGLGSLQ